MFLELNGYLRVNGDLKKNHGLFDLLSVSFGHGMGSNCQKKSFFQHDVLGHGMTDLLAISWFFPFDGP
jgi:hypothetical protein